jgi:CHASE1-domain containing sensor protein
MNTNILLIGLSIVLLALFLNQERSSINFKKEFAEWQSLYMKFYDTK